MQTDSSNQTNYNAQTLRLRSVVQQGDSLTTRRTGPLGQIFFCDGCCCGRVEKGFPELPKQMIKAQWKALKLNGTIQLTISGCLGPCDLANVVFILGSDGSQQWLGGLSETWQYETLLKWAADCQQSSSLLPIPANLDGYRFERFS
ncbi:MAG: (2Fe-2S) ferredoxin domain-containing protein [Planctomycetota bacterium]